MHLNPGEIRAYRDQELSDPARQHVEVHLASCARCQATAHELNTQAQDTGNLLSRLNPDPKPQIIDIHIARMRLAARLARHKKEPNLMLNTIFSRVPKSAWIAIALTLVLAFALAFPGVRAAAVSFLGLFRVDQIQVVEVDLEQLPGGLGSSANLEKIFSKDVKIEEMGQSQEVASSAEAAKLSGMVVRLPDSIDLEPAYYIQSGGSMTFNVDLELVKAVLKDIEREDIQLPKELDNAVVQVKVNSGVVTMYGDCRYEEPAESASSEDPDQPEVAVESRFREEKVCISLIQIPSPEITAPPELNLAQIGEAYLQLLGFSREEAASFARNIDWSSTFVIPISRESQFSEVMVDGVTGVLLNSYGSISLVWIKDGVIYALNGTGSAEEMLAIANSLR